MKLRHILAPLALVAATPAFATGTIACRSTISPTDGPQLWLVIGSSPSGIVQARISYGNRELVTGQGEGAPVIAQSWLDRNSLRLAIMDANAETEILRLETWRRAGSSYAGSLRHDGRTWQVRCTEEG